MLALKFGITSIPTLMLFKDGKEADKLVGLSPRRNLKQPAGLRISAKRLKTLQKSAKKSQKLCKKIISKQKKLLAHSEELWYLTK